MREATGRIEAALSGLTSGHDNPELEAITHEINRLAYFRGRTAQCLERLIGADEKVGGATT
jgi:hypothetical protein